MKIFDGVTLLLPLSTLRIICLHELASQKCATVAKQCSIANASGPKLDSRFYPLSNFGRTPLLSLKILSYSSDKSDVSRKGDEPFRIHSACFRKGCLLRLEGEPESY